uniref:Pheromone n=1 Tax=Agrocybe salicacicola TaxID=1078488 RepID=A0A2P0M879_9AGAR|nr:pheromone precursor [Agrocybe salicacicola]
MDDFTSFDLENMLSSIDIVERTPALLQLVPNDNGPLVDKERYGSGTTSAFCVIS